LQHRTQFVRRSIGHGDVQTFIVEPKWDCEILARHPLRHQGDSIRFRVVATEVHNLHVENLAQYLCEITLANDAHVDKDLSQAFTRLLLHETGLADL
jgi:hypothetical protein